MSSLEITRGPFSDAALVALFTDNTAPTPLEIVEAIRDAEVYGDVADRLVKSHGILDRVYIRNQPIYGPLVRVMGMAGWTVSGSGYFSVAFFKGGLAIKLGLRIKEDAAITYLHWCKDNAELPGVPFLHAMGTYDAAYAVVMDRYEAIAGELDPATVLYDPAIAAEFEAIRTGINQGFIGNFVTSPTAALIRREFAEMNAFDVNSSNVMLDRDRNLIITDPLGMTGYEEDAGASGYESYSLAA